MPPRFLLDMVEHCGNIMSSGDCHCSIRIINARLLVPPRSTTKPHPITLLTWSNTITHTHTHTTTMIKQRQNENETQPKSTKTSIRTFCRPSGISTAPRTSSDIINANLRIPTARPKLDSGWSHSGNGRGMSTVGWTMSSTPRRRNSPTWRWRWATRSIACTISSRGTKRRVFRRGGSVWTLGRNCPTVTIR
jgi:hypothetical protein